MDSTEAILQKTEELLFKEARKSEFVPSNFVTPYDAYYQFLAVCDRALLQTQHSEKFRQYLMSNFHTENLEEALTPEVLYELAYQELINMVGEPAKKE